MLTLDMKRLLSALLGVALLTTVSLAQSFSDVPASHLNADAIDYFVRMNVVHGYRDNTFRPSQLVTRAEATKMTLGSIKPIAVIQGVKNDLVAQYNHYFSDVKADDWFAPYVLMAHNQKVVNGYPDNTFRPNSTIKFAEGLKLIFEAYGIDTSNTVVLKRELLYANKGDWFAPYFNEALNRNILNPAKYYHPSQRMTRGEFLEVLYRTKMVTENDQYRYDGQAQGKSSEYTIYIPQLNLVNVQVGFADPYNATSALDVLKSGLGHYLAPPGSGEKLVLFGHSSGYNWDSSEFKEILRGINALQPGDHFYINYQEKAYVYQVNHSEIIPQNELVKVMDPTPSEELVMYTCWPPNHTSHRYLIYAKPI